MKALAEALKVNTSIKYIDLSCNQIGNEGMKKLSEAIKVNSSIKYISLFNNKIGSEGMVSLAEALKVNTSITNIFLYDNQIGPEGLKILIDALQYNYIIEYIGIYDNSGNIKELLKPKNRKQRIIEWMPWKNHHICIKLEPRFHDIVLTLLYLFFIPQIFLRREKQRLRQQKKF
jgi:hypothetical protein